METNEQRQGDNDSYGDKSPHESDILVSLESFDCVTESRRSFTTVLWEYDQGYQQSPPDAKTVHLPQQRPLSGINQKSGSYHLWPHRPVSLRSAHSPGVTVATAQPPEVNDNEGHRTLPLKNNKNNCKSCKLADQLKASRMAVKRHLPLMLSHKPDEEATDVWQ